MPRATHDRPASRTQTQRKCRTQTQNAKRTAPTVRFFMSFPMFFHRPSPYVSLLFGGEQVLSWLSGLPQRFCAAKALWDNFRAPAKIAWRVLWEEERQVYKVMRQTKRAADQTALPRRGVALTICELGYAPLFGAFQGSRADAKQMRGKRSSANTTAREAGSSFGECR